MSYLKMLTSDDFLDMDTIKIPVDEYLNSLPSDIEKINLKNRGLKILPDLSRFTNLKNLECEYNVLESLPNINTLEILNCFHNKLNEIPLINNLKILNCGENNLKTIPKINNLVNLKCYNNKIEYIPQLDNLKYLFCQYNKLEYLPKLDSLEILHCSNNKIKCIRRYNKLIYLDCSCNNIIEILPQDKLQNYYSKYNDYVILSDYTKLYENPIYNIINNFRKYDLKNNYHKRFEYIKENLIIIHKFKYLYYLLKYKNKFRNLLWDKIRKPKIEQYYSPNNLIKLIEENSDNYDEALYNW